MDIEKLKNKYAKEDLNDLTKEIGREVKTIGKIKGKMKGASKEDRLTYQEYIDALQAKIKMILEAMTEGKAHNANLAQLAKAFRVISEKATLAQGKPTAITEERRVAKEEEEKIKKLDTKELLEMLSRKSRESNVNGEA